MAIDNFNISNRSGTQLALWHFSSNDAIADKGLSLSPAMNRSVAVVLAHGTFSNHRSCRGLAQFLSKKGFSCWILDFQGHGASDKPIIEPDFESMCLEDVDAVLEHLKKNGFPSVYWIGHSGGGLAALMHQSRQSKQGVAIEKLVVLGSQATHAGRNYKNRCLIRISRQITRMMGIAPGRYFGIGPENEFARVMLQWYDWSLSGKWQGSDGFDYEAALSKIRVPFLCFAGEGDTFIAPVDGCRHIFEKFGGTEKTFHYCGKTTGYAENYTHSRLISSSSAAKEIWPLVADWLKKT